MAGLTSTVTLLFFLFAFSHARTPSDFPVNDVVDRDLSTSMPESDIKQTILLPSQKSEPLSDPTTVFVELEAEPEEPERKPQSQTLEVEPTQEQQPEFDASTGNEIPRTQPSAFVGFHPINRHFRMKRQFPVRLPVRRCHHHHHHMKPMMNPRFHGPDVSYGHDMILSSAENSDFDLETFREAERQVPARWVRLIHHHRHHHDDGMPRFSFRNHDKFAKEKFKRPFRREEEETEREKEKERQERDEGGFMKRFRKFLNHF